MPRKFYRTTYTYVVLSEEPMPDGMSLDRIAEECYDGGCVGAFASGENPKVETLTGLEMVTALYDAGSEPGFFSLDDNGNDPVEDPIIIEEDDDNPGLIIDADGTLSLLHSLSAYVTPDDANLPHDQFLQMIADRIHDDLKMKP